MNELFLMQVCRVLRPGGPPAFLDRRRGLLPRCPLELIADRIPLQGPYDVEESPATHDLDYRTHFERRMRQAWQAHLPLPIQQVISDRHASG